MISQHLVSPCVIHNGEVSYVHLHKFRLKRTNGDRPLHPSRVTTVHGPAADRALRGATRLRYWERLSHGLYVPRGRRPLAVDLAAWQLVLPESACFYVSKLS